MGSTLITLRIGNTRSLNELGLPSCFSGPGLHEELPSCDMGMKSREESDCRKGGDPSGDVGDSLSCGMSCRGRLSSATLSAPFRSPPSSSTFVAGCISETSKVRLTHPRKRSDPQESGVPQSHPQQVNTSSGLSSGYPQIFENWRGGYIKSQCSLARFSEGRDESRTISKNKRRFSTSEIMRVVGADNSPRRSNRVCRRSQGG